MKPFFPRIWPVLVIASMFLASCGTPYATPDPSPTPVMSTTLTPTATSIPPLSDDVWDRIKANNKIVVGVAWDYPPFASVDSNFNVVGLDIAVIEEVGRRLNIPVDIQNFTFEGLTGALQLNQIDLAIAAISITPERATQMTFSSIYFVNQTAILARSDSTVVINDFKQLAGFRVGVQRGTVYEKMAQSLLVDSGLMGSDKLLSYMQSDEAIRDLMENRVDMVVLGLATASYYKSKNDLKIVGQGFDQQDLAVGMRLGTPRLKAEIDREMDAMLTDGTLLSMIQTYVQSDAIGVLPTPFPTNQPTVTPLPPIPTLTPPPCWDGMKFVADVTYPDNNMKNPSFVTPGTAFVKTWRVQNTGTCAWTPNYRLVYAYGNITGAQMSGQPLNIPGNVAPGQLVDLSVPLVAPITPATYQGFWQIENAGGARFGQTIWVGITTLAVQPTPVANIQPACVVTLGGPTNAITAGSSFDTVWTVKNTSGGDWSIDSVDYKFISGTSMHQVAVYDFTQTIKNGESGQIIVDMVAPGTPGIYSAEWAIVSGSSTFCTLNVTVTVK